MARKQTAASGKRAAQRAAGAAYERLVGVVRLYTPEQQYEVLLAASATIAMANLPGARIAAHALEDIADALDHGGGQTYDARLLLLRRLNDHRDRLRARLAAEHGERTEP